MTRTVAQHSADYRKRRAAKLARYEAALLTIAETSDDQRAVATAHAAIYGDLRAQLVASIKETKA